MGKIGLAFRIFFRTLFQQRVAEQVEQLFRDDTLPKSDIALPSSAASPSAPKSEPRPTRSEAITLLAALQREARLIDLVQEPLTAYSDQQVGAAARDVLGNCRQVLERLFDLQPVLTESEGATVEVPKGFDAAKFRLTGNLTGEAPFRGALAHHGWQASRCQLPEWSGSKAAALIVAPAEVELK
ncbi:MAG TPA: DUF2760 domain-containing protein [Pirellulaceae bacterium]|nr:DUF2760 domain-containing protein [Pirellulaceae bacterium]